MRGRLILLLEIILLLIGGLFLLLIPVLDDWQLSLAASGRTINTIARTNLGATIKTAEPAFTATRTPLPLGTASRASGSTATKAPLSPTSPTVDSSSRTFQVGGTIWNDGNRNGIRDTEEPGVKDVFVDLYASKFQWFAGTQSDTNGNYSFDALPGNYVVVIEVPSGYISTVDSQDTYHPERWIDDEDNGLGTKGEVITSHPIPLQSDSAAGDTIDFGLQEVAAEENQLD